MARKANKFTAAVKGIGGEVRHGGWQYKAIVKHLGGGGTTYYRFNGEWKHIAQANIPPAAYRHLRKALNANIKIATDPIIKHGAA